MSWRRSGGTRREKGGGARLSTGGEGATPRGGRVPWRCAADEARQGAVVRAARAAWRVARGRAARAPREGRLVYGRGGNTPWRAMQYVSERYGGIVLWAWPEPVLAIAFGSMWAVPAER